MASHDASPVLVMLPDRSVRLFDCLPGSTLTADDVLRGYPGHSLGKFQDARKPSLDLKTSLAPGATYYLTARRQSPPPTLAQLDADVTSSSIPSTPSSACSPRTENHWAICSPSSSVNGHVAASHTPRTPRGLVKSSSLKSDDEEDCSWNSHRGSSDQGLRFSMPFPPRPAKSASGKQPATTPRYPRPPVSPSPKNSILKELQELEDAERRCGIAARNPFLADLEDAESDCTFVFSRTSTTGRRSTGDREPMVPISRSRQSVCTETEAIKFEIAAAKAQLKQMAAVSPSAQVSAKKMEKKKQMLRAAAMLGKLGGFRSLGRRRAASAPMQTLGETSNNLPSCMDLESLCQPDETEVEWDWNSNAQMFY